MKISQHFVLKANSILGCIRKDVAKRLRRVIPSLSSALLKPYWEYYIHVWALWHKRQMEILKKVQRTEALPNTRKHFF